MASHLASETSSVSNWNIATGVQLFELDESPPSHQRLDDMDRPWMQRPESLVDLLV